jgi:hypothetical protein
MPERYEIFKEPVVKAFRDLAIELAKEGFALGCLFVGSMEGKRMIVMDADFSNDNTAEKDLNMRLAMLHDLAEAAVEAYEHYEAIVKGEKLPDKGKTIVQ